LARTGSSKKPRRKEEESFLDERPEKERKVEERKYAQGGHKMGNAREKTTKT